jgi:hypothetical protein
MNNWLVDISLYKDLNEWANILIVMCLFSVIYSVGNRSRSPDISEINRHVIMMLCAFLATLVVRIGYWVPASAMAADGVRVEPNFIEWRWVMLVFTSMLCLHFTHKLFASLSEFSWRRTIKFYSLMLGGALVLALVI